MIDINKLIEGGAPEEVILEAVRKNKEEKAKAEEEARLKAQAQEKKTQMEYRKEGRMHLINALLAYDDAFHFFGDEPLDKEDIADLEKAIIQLEELIPVYAKLLDIEKKFKDGDMSALGF